ncbi:hypothetical protein CU280_08655 [Yersinia mollaretii]|nr:hypothetical protein CU280_08655 [Yersinia mollaretii]
MYKLYPSYFKLHVRWLPSFTPVTDSCKLLGNRSVAAFLQLELFKVYIPAIEIAAKGKSTGRGNTLFI